MSSYSSDAIEVLSGLDPVRKRPGMYTDTTRPNHLVQEVVDNSVDEALAGFATEIIVQLYADHSISVSDNGRGMPVDIHPEEQIPGVELILTRLHAGGKFNNQHYQFSGGLHGVGVSVVNALSAWLRVVIKRDGQNWRMAFTHGEKTEALSQTGSIPQKQQGTDIHFFPDARYFDHPHISVTSLERLLKAKAVLCSGLKVVLINHLKTDEEGKPQQQIWQFDDGLADYLQQTIGAYESLLSQPFSGKGIEVITDGEATGERILFPHATDTDRTNARQAGKKRAAKKQVKQEYTDHADQAEILNKTSKVQEILKEVAWIVTWAELPNLLTESYVNLIPTIQGGTHVNGFRTGLLEAVKEFCDYRNLIPKQLKLTTEDISHNCHYILSVKLQEPQFSGQTKERLSSREAAAFVTAIVKDSFSLWLNKHPQEAELLAEQICNQAQQRMRAHKKILRKRISQGPALPGKLADCVATDPSVSEIFLVEGDSAGGSARQARDKNFQAVMPLRGKILNTWEVKGDQLFGSQEIHDIAIALGVDAHSDNTEPLRYHKICILADADSDGLHIATLLCALFVQHFPALVRCGYVYVATPPLYRLDQEQKTFYALDEQEKEQIIKKLKNTSQKTINVQRFKGLGEMNPMQLRETTMHPDTRRLVRLDVSDWSDTRSILDKLLAKKRSQDRKVWLEACGDQAAAHVSI